LSDALRQLNEQTKDYTISFLYNELEDFRVTTAVHRKSVPDAIRQMIGFYPIRMEVHGEDIIVECVKKTTTRYKGTVIDEQGVPLPYANIALLSPKDSTLLTGGVSNESGFFVIPCEEGSVLARISYVGYKTIYKHCHSTALGTIQLQPDNFALKEVTVKGARPLVKMVGDAFVTIVEGSYLSKTGTGHDVLAHIPGVLRDGNNIEVLGRGAPLIYINGRQMRNQGELDQLSSDQIKEVEVVMTPGAKYDASAKAVIRIKTLRPVGEGFSFDNMTLIGTNRSVFGQEEVNLNYRTGGLDIFAMVDYEDFRMKVNNTHSQNIFLQRHYTQEGKTDYRHHSNIYYGKLGFNYMFNDRHSIGMTYSPASRPNKEKNNFLTDSFTDGISDDHLTGDGHEEAERTEHAVNAYYSGTIGKWSLDANADMLFQNETTDAFTLEAAKESDDRTVTTRSDAKNRLYAAKIVAGHPLWKGKLEMGTEGSVVHRTDAFANPEKIISDSDTKTEETQGAIFAELTQQWGKLTTMLGLRYEYVDSRYYQHGVRQDDESRIYNDLFPSAMMAWQIGRVHTRMSYARNISRPAFAQLTGNLTYINRYLYERGNPYLRPTYRDNLSLAANWKWMMAMIDYAHVHDYIVSEYSTYNGDPSVALLQKDNTKGFNNLQAMVHFAPNFGGYHPQLMLAVMWQDLKVQYQGKTKKMSHPMSIIRFNNAVNLPHDIWINADFSWRSAGDSENIHMAGSWQFDISLYKSFFNDRLSIKLACDDLFASMRQKINIYSDIHQFYLDKRLDNRKLKLTVRYNFNPAKSKYRGQGAGSDVKQRL
ncbi:MAG: TonB-dependent receptor, partial [Prevotella sp.]|nr:TonB-dependent receptor [Prevotella sp.]